MIIRAESASLSPRLPISWYSMSTPNPSTAENQLWPLGLPYYTGHTMPMLRTWSSVQKGRGSQW
jgi:hypothetical protein